MTITAMDAITATIAVIAVIASRVVPIVVYMLLVVFKAAANIEAEIIILDYAVVTLNVVSSISSKLVFDLNDLVINVGLAGYDGFMVTFVAVSDGIQLILG